MMTFQNIGKLLLLHSALVATVLLPPLSLAAQETNAPAPAPANMKALLKQWEGLVNDSYQYMRVVVYPAQSHEVPQPKKEAMAQLISQQYPPLKAKINAALDNSRRGAEFQHELRHAQMNYDLVLENCNKILELLATEEDYEEPVKVFQAEDILEVKVAPLTTEVLAQLQVLEAGKVNVSDEKVQDRRSLYIGFGVVGVLLLFALLALRSRKKQPE